MTVKCKVEEAKMSLDDGSSNRSTSTCSGINVEQAQKDFAELNRELSISSQHVGHASKEQRQGAISFEAPDLEKSSSSVRAHHGDWDLETILRGARSLDQESGIKPKRVGVVWDNLAVTGVGWVKNYVRTFPDAFVSFNVPETICHLFGWDLNRKKKEVDLLRGLRGLAKPGNMVIVLGRPGSGCST